MLNPIDEKYGIISTFSDNSEFYEGFDKNCIFNDIGEAIYQAVNIENVLYFNNVNLDDEHVTQSVKVIIHNIIQQIMMNRINVGMGEPIIPLKNVKANGLKEYFHIELETSRK